ncbi:hypothetical protein WOLCODRAFT_158847 [Wolfiporia cocos MD-104 SS10]|uniref:Uncharacterized protein n=1 Tax=Wolfiporia cocos (strain MD-104) TaxID=742152 RepID=A0A2H3JAK0_WOLCO|nr:hypothetical protein WOLCODRAFT_158847 [Wolfiporia cocos MD-104 SS10]
MRSHFWRDRSRLGAHGGAARDPLVLTTAHFRARWLATPLARSPRRSTAWFRLDHLWEHMSLRVCRVVSPSRSAAGEWRERHGTRGLEIMGPSLRLHNPTLGNYGLQSNGAQIIMRRHFLADGAGTCGLRLPAPRLLSKVRIVQIACQSLG